MSKAENFHLRVTCGTAYDSHDSVLVNTSTPTRVSSSEADVDLWVHVKNFRGMVMPLPLPIQLVNVS
jgi:hypothetical protein